MPSSNPENISQVVEWITDIDPGSVLDCGIGFGKYGFLTREYTDIRHLRYRKSEWKVRIDGIEIWSDYETKVWSFIYDNVYEGDVCGLTKTFVNYDLVLLCDIVEHLKKEIALELIQWVRSYNSNVIIVTPNGYLKQGPWNGNEHEKHLCGFVEDDFKDVHDIVKTKKKLLVWLKR